MLSDQNYLSTYHFLLDKMNAYIQFYEDLMCLLNIIITINPSQWFFWFKYHSSTQNSLYVSSQSSYSEYELHHAHFFNTDLLTSRYLVYFHGHSVLVQQVCFISYEVVKPNLYHRSKFALSSASSCFVYHFQNSYSKYIFTNKGERVKPNEISAA